MRKFVFKGQQYRAQLTVWDWSEYEPLRPTSYSVLVLPQSMNKYTAFSLKCGNLVYRGDNLRDAWHAVQRYCGRVQWPQRLNDYLKDVP